MFAKARRHRDSTASTPTTSALPTPVSPIQQDFDFGLQSLASPVSVASEPWTVKTSERPASSRSIVSLQPPVLPPIPRVASANRHDRNEASTSRDYHRQEVGTQARERDGGEESADSSRKDVLGSDWDFNPSFSWQDSPSKDGQGDKVRPGQQRSKSNHAPSQSLLDMNFDTPVMEASMFPRPEVQGPANFYTGGPAMTRSFIDSRDKPYVQTAHRPPPIQSSYSSPDMLSPRSPANPQSANGRSPLSPGSAMSGSSRLSPHSATSPRDTRKSPSVAPTNYSGSTARPSTQSSTSTATSPLQHQTIGTPYQETSPSFPAPQHVATRPKTTGSSSTIAGVMVPTHHTGSQLQDKGKSEKRKTRLLNPMALLVRRKSAQEPVVVPDNEELRLRAQAQARQKRVATIGVNPMPEDFDPRIRGKVVHDFSAPRFQRNFSYSDAERRPSEQLQHTNSMPLISLPLKDSQQEQSSHQPKQPSEAGSRSSRHTPVFVEHLNEDPDTHRRVSSVQAEQLENRDFLNRASHQSTYSAFSQDGSALPPFARRSQQMDPMQASFYRDDESKRSSDPSSSNGRDSNVSSVGLVSPLFARASDNGAAEPRSSVTPVSPQSPALEQRSPGGASTHIRELSPLQMNPPQDFPIKQGQTSLPSAPPATTRSIADQGEVLGETAAIPLPDYENAAPEPSAAPSHISRDAPGTLVLPPRDFDANPSPMSSPRFGSSAASTPEPATFGTAVAVKSSSSPPRLVEKRASAVGHSKRLSAVPRHQPSTASRFSFQMGESAAEERILEEKHKKLAANGERAAKTGIPDEDDEDYFDEDAMDDEDEMELMNREPAFSGGPGVYLSPPSEHMHDSDDDSVYDEEIPEIGHERDGAYNMHQASHTHSGDKSAQPSVNRSSSVDEYMHDGYNSQHQRYLSDASVMSSSNGDGINTFIQRNLSPDGNADKPRSNFYMQPHAAGYSPNASPLEEKSPNMPSTSGTENTQKPREEFGSPMSITSGGTVPSRGSVMSASTNQSTASYTQEPRTAATTVSPEPVRKSTNGLGLSGFSDFVFTDGPDLSLGNSPATSPQNLSRPATAGHRNTVELPNYGQWNAVDHTPHPSQQIQHFDYARQSYDDQNDMYSSQTFHPTSHAPHHFEDPDDMYFDDGNFAHDIPSPSQMHGVNESDFDRPDFLGGFHGMEPRPSHQNHLSLSSSGPYPTFAIPNPIKARQRDSRMLLEDLPLQTAVDPRWIPQRNPSEDAKRLGLSDRVPPLPGLGGLAGYHQALADAAMRAAAEGRFVRQASVASTARSGSVCEAGEQGGGLDERGAEWEEADPASQFRAQETNAFREQERSTFQEEHQNAFQAQEPTAPLPPAQTAAPTDAVVSQQPQIPYYQQQHHHPNPSITTPSRLNFDFGFPSPSNNAAPSDFDDYASDDYTLDDIAAANASALASDDTGFYGQEFGFYAKARPSSSHSKNQFDENELQAVNGGYFGLAGDDGLARGRSLREPNLTPITERSEFSTRNSFISLAQFGPASARLPISPLVGRGEVQRLSGGVGYFGQVPLAAGVRTPGGESPASAKAMPFSSPPRGNNTAEFDATPRRQEPATARKVTAGHERQGSDSVAYVREQDPSSPGQPRWVLERRRTGEGGKEVVGREVVRGGWI